MTPRQMNILCRLVEENLDTHDAVSSLLLSEHFELSPATLRNEMAVLEQEGYISPLHPSSGRVPTEEGYRFFTSHFLDANKITPEERKHILRTVTSEMIFIPHLKQIARVLTDLSGNLVFVSFSQTEVYFSGISYLVQQCALMEEQRENWIDVIHSLEQGELKLFSPQEELNIYIGSENPLCSDGSLILFPWTREQDEGVLGLMGPMFMDYSHNFSLMNYCFSLLQTKNEQSSSIDILP